MENPKPKEFGEEQVGIQEYLAPASEQVPIVCAVKHRYSDFIVNEIDENGDVVWFRSELANQVKWSTANIRQTLPQSVMDKLSAVDA